MTAGHLPLIRAALLLVLIGCNGDTQESADPCADRYAVTWNNWGQDFFATYCDSCHAADTPDRQGAPEAFTFDTLDEVRTWESAIRESVLVDETMPLGGGLPEDDIVLLQDFLDCGL